MCVRLLEGKQWDKAMRPEMTKDRKGVFRWKSNNAVIPPQWLENEGIVFDVELQYADFLVMAELHQQWWVRMPHSNSTDAHNLTMFLDMAMGRNILRPAIGERKPHE